ncbi:MAG: DNRLRE domain-containing protein [Calditrichaeota bacterium]|nr:DNRLRE domain-containing protein [Calditrichota bacterium]
MRFKTRTTDIFLLKPIQDSFTEDAGIIGPYRNIANMGWLYLMVGKKRYSFLEFPSVSSQGNARKVWLNLHVRNKQGDMNQLYVRKVGSEWDENSITWNTQPDILDTCLGAVTESQFNKGNWITFQLAPDNSIKTGLNIAIISPDSGWVSLDSKDSFDAQPELIIDYRKTYVLNGKVSFAQREPLDNVSVTIKSIEDSATVYSADTIVTNSNGHFETSLKLGNTYTIGFTKESEKEDLKAISIYDAYLAAATAIGIVEPAEDAKMAADANGDGKITIYDALLIAKTAVGLNAGGVIGHWYFPQVPDVLNETQDSVAISEGGVVMGDVDCSWPDASVYSLALKNSDRQNLFQLTENDSNVVVSLPNLGVHRLGSFSIDFSFNSDAFVFKRVQWPVSMQNWSTVRNIRKGRVQLGCFHPEKSSVRLGNFKLIFSKRKNEERFKIVIHRIQLDNRINRNILMNGIEEEKKEPVEDSFSVYPNPFNMSTRIEGNLSKSTPINLSIFNALGQLVFSKTIASHKGRYSFIWKGKDNQNSFVSSGIYYILLRTKTKNFGQKVLFLK